MPSIDKNIPAFVPEIGAPTAKDGVDHNIPTHIDHADVVHPSSCLCSWTQMCEALGNRQGTFIVALRPLRATMIKTEQELKMFKTQLELGTKTRTSAQETARMIHHLKLGINSITAAGHHNAPPDELVPFRRTCDCLVELEVYLGAEAAATPEVQRPSRASSRNNLAVNDDPAHDQTRDDIDETPTRAPGTMDEHSLKEKIDHNCAEIESLINYIDRKTARRWWLRDVINFMKLFIKLALFVSAAVTVAYVPGVGTLTDCHDDRGNPLPCPQKENKIAPIITLSLAIMQGVVELLDFYFLRHTKPEDISLPIMNAMSHFGSRV